MDNLLKWVARLGLANWLSWIAEQLAIGGNALDGKISDGRYFVSSHAVLTEVSRSTFLFSYWHSISAWISFPLAVLAGIIWGRRNPRSTPSVDR
jgi:hypothetical protein